MVVGVNAAKRLLNIKLNYLLPKDVSHGYIEHHLLREVSSNHLGLRLSHCPSSFSFQVG